jgi:PAP2 superfamily
MQFYKALLLIIFQTLLLNFVIAQQTDSVKIEITSSGSPIKPGVFPYLLPAAFIGYGMLALGDNTLKRFDHHLQNNITEKYPHFSTKADNYLQFAPAVAVYALNVSGLNGKNNFRDRTMIYLISNAVMEVIVYAGKTTAHKLRPDGSAYNSFPSGHTATAFVGAEFFYQEYKDVSPWYGVAGYVLATTTGVLRMYNNRHWFSDVVAGAGVGIASTKLSYLIYPAIQKFLFKKNATNMVLFPTYQNQNIRLYYIHNF